MSRYDIPDSDPPVRTQHSFAAAAANFWDAMGRTSKRVAFLFAAVGMISTVASSSMAVWVAQKGFVTEDQHAKLEALLRDMSGKLDRNLDVLNNNVGSQGARIAILESWDRTQDDRIAGKKDKSR